MGRGGDALIGVWQLISCEHTVGDQIHRPFGERPLGYLIYTPEGLMSASLMTRERRSGAGPDTDPIVSMDFQSYCGRYTYEDGVVTHHIEVGFRPSDVGSRKSRRVEMRGGDLILSSASQPDAERPYTARLVWRRVQPAT